MKDVLKKTICVFATIVVLMGSVIVVNAQDTIDTNDIVDEQLEIFDVNSLLDSLPDDAKEILLKSGIDDVTPEKVTESSAFDFIGEIFVQVKSKLATPTKLFVKISGIILVCSLITSVLHLEEGSASRIFAIIGVLCVCIAIIQPVTTIIENAVIDIEKSGEFMLSFIPMYSGVIATTGAVTSATFYSGVMLGVVNLMLQVTTNIIVPIIGMYFGFCIVGSVNDTISVQGIISTFKTTILWVLGFIFTIFIGIMSLQGIITSTQDTMTIKTAKFMFGSFIPIIGATISEAFNSIQGCVGIIKSTVGTFGIMSIAVIYLPIIINIWITICALKISSAISEVFSNLRIKFVLDTASSVLVIICAVVIFVALLMIVSTSIMLIVGFGL